MKNRLLLFGIFITNILVAQTVDVRSTVYQWNDLDAVKETGRERRQILEGTTTDLSHLSIHASTLEPGKAPHAPHSHADEEELIIVTAGKLKVTIDAQSKVIGPGSVAVALPGDIHGFENGGDVPVTYYIFRYKSKLPIDLDRSKQAGGSFIVDWNDIVFTPHDKGGIRHFFEKPTAMFSRFEMHVTTLNAGLKSHDPHTHRAEEVILLMKGNAEMQIAGNHLPASPGALIFLGSEIPHAIRNTGEEPCVYFAFQWQ
ncbi:MAG TPA: cupin domain-containing protein [Cyclobacteriaceae bacterium]|nr:cupin domain-containing protein [Cyclobacteriaceae bacterium]